MGGRLEQYEGATCFECGQSVKQPVGQQAAELTCQWCQQHMEQTGHQEVLKWYGVTVRSLLQAMGGVVWNAATACGR